MNTNSPTVYIYKLFNMYSPVLKSVGISLSYWDREN